MIDRYDIKEISSIFTLDNRYKYFLKIELAALEAGVKLNIIPKEDYLKIKRKAKIDVNQINEFEKIYKHDVIAFTRSVDTFLGEEKRWFHYGLTSTDVVDSASSLMYKDASDIVINDIISLLNTYKKLAIEYKDVPCIGRTHGVHAEITSFGLKFVRFYDELNRDLKRLIEARNDLCVIKLEGSIGTFAFIDPQIEKLVAKKFKLNNPRVATQVISRDNHSFFLGILSLIGEHLNNVALEFRNLSRNEINEVNEYFSINQKGSSAMPHKHNPISFENISGLSRLLKGYYLTSLENIPLFHERDISHSSNERIMIPDALITTSYILRRMNNTISKMIINIDDINKNISLTHNVIFSQRVLQELINKGNNREDSYDLIQSLIKYTLNNNLDFYDVINENEIINKYFNKEEIKSLFDYKFYLKNIDYIYKRVGIINDK